LLVTDTHCGKNRRSTDRPVTFQIHLKLSQQRSERSNTQGFAAGAYVETCVQVVIHPRRDRDRRREATMDKARRLLGSLKSYLMAREADEAPAATQTVAAE
jgi:hypothetical protein